MQFDGPGISFYFSKPFISDACSPYTNKCARLREAAGRRPNNSDVNGDFLIVFRVPFTLSCLLFHPPIIHEPSRESQR